MTKTHTFALALLFALGQSIAFAGPKVAPHPNSQGVVQVMDNTFSVICKLTDSDDIAVVQEIFARAERIGTTETHLKTPSHKIDFEDRWLIDFDDGEIGVLSKAHSPVYRLNKEDLQALKKLLREHADSDPR